MAQATEELKRTKADNGPRRTKAALRETPNKETLEAMAELEAGRGAYCKNLKELYRVLDEGS